MKPMRTSGLNEEVGNIQHTRHGPEDGDPPVNGAVITVFLRAKEFRDKKIGKE